MGSDKAKSYLSRFGWLAVLGATLTMSDYSLYFVARHLGTPVIFAVLGGVIFDGAALVFADISLKHARIGSSGSGSRLAVILCAGLSAYLNSLHTVFAHQISVARIFWAAPPIIAVAAYEYHVRYERRRALVNAGKVAPDLPAMGKLAWILFPVKTWRIARTIVRYRLGLLLARHTPGMVHVNPPVAVPGSDEIPGEFTQIGPGLHLIQPGFDGTRPGFEQTSQGFSQTPTPNLADVRKLLPGTTQHARDWLQRRGYPVGTTGPVSPKYLTLYRQALQAGSEPPADSATEPEATEPPDDNPIREANGYHAN